MQTPLLTLTEILSGSGQQNGIVVLFTVRDVTDHTDAVCNLYTARITTSGASPVEFDAVGDDPGGVQDNPTCNGNVFFAGPNFDAALGDHTLSLFLTADPNQVFVTCPITIAATSVTFDANDCTNP